MVEVNPLTRLPGNISINRTIQDLIDKRAIFAVGYGDLDNFKPFNDHYGFSRGDEVIKMTGRLILNVVKNRQPAGSFVGHIGGDDFIFLMDADLVDGAASEIVETFDRIISTFYDSADKEAGASSRTDRQGNSRPFPLMTISIGVDEQQEPAVLPLRRDHRGGVRDEALREHAKGSCYRSDKRQWRHGKE